MVPHLLGRVVQDQERGECAGVQGAGELLEVPDPVSSVVYVAHVLDQVCWCQFRTRVHLANTLDQTLSRPNRSRFPQNLSYHELRSPQFVLSLLR